MSYYSITMHDDYLAHHGIMGQKWGVRRFQNPDGTLTDAGKRRVKGDKVSNKNMTSKMRDEYAKNRISANDGDARQAIQDEEDYRRIQNLLSGVKAGATVLGGAAGAGLIAYAASGGNPLAAAGAAYVTGVLGSVPVTLITGLVNEKHGINTNRNIATIKKIADIPDTTVGARSNASEQHVSDENLNNRITEIKTKR